MTIHVFEVDIVKACAGKNDQISCRRVQPLTTSAFSVIACETPDFVSNGQRREFCLHPTKFFLFGDAPDAIPKFQPHWIAPNRRLLRQ